MQLASYNIHKCVGLDRRRKPERIAAVLSELGADILVLQETDYRLGNRPAAFPRSLAQDSTGLVVLPFAIGPTSLGWHGQTILVRPDWNRRDLCRIALPALEPRGAVLAELDTPAGPFRVVGLHLGLIRRYRKMQLSAIAAAMSVRPSMPTVVIGDFNEWSQRGGIDTLGHWFRNHSPGASFPADRPVARLDRLALGPMTHLLDAGVHRSHTAQIASDHLPIWARVRVEQAG